MVDCTDAEHGIVVVAIVGIIICIVEAIVGIVSKHAGVIAVEPVVNEGAISNGVIKRQ